MRRVLKRIPDVRAQSEVQHLRLDEFFRPDKLKILIRHIFDAELVQVLLHNMEVCVLLGNFDARLRSQSAAEPG